MKWVHLPCELLWTKIAPTLHATTHCAPVTVPSGGEVFSFCPPWFLPMRTWATRIRKRKSAGLVVSACFLLEPTLLWGSLGENPMKKKCHCWTTVWLMDAYWVFQSSRWLGSTWSSTHPCWDLSDLLTHKTRGLTCVTNFWNGMQWWITRTVLLSTSTFLRAV